MGLDSSQKTEIKQSINKLEHLVNSSKAASKTKSRTGKGELGWFLIYLNLTFILILNLFIFNFRFSKMFLSVDH